jgi:hypothetical protein
MPRPRVFRELRLLNGSTGDPCLFVDDQGRDNVLLIDCGDNAVLGIAYPGAVDSLGFPRRSYLKWVIRRARESWSTNRSHNSINRNCTCSSRWA